MKREAAGYGGWIVVVVVFAFVLATGVGLASMGVRPWFLQLETNQNRATQQYVEAEVSLMMKLVQDYNQMNTDIAVWQSEGGHDDAIASAKAQQEQIRRRLQLERTKVGAEYVPPEVNRIEK